MLQENGDTAGAQKAQKAVSPRAKAGGSPRAAAAEAAKVELQQQLSSLQKQLETALQDLKKQRASNSSSEQVWSCGSPYPTSQLA